ncbi:ABC transporter permease [Mucilaginibacter myungsuensis]|uniref:ABC transporter permease n=1 Tax=Mucilaginibacter myungsuensis TaxID=649104 RepID=A0A929KVH9_9SPHI|nr:ABC transporter permease [Mucilaginibacter myungsuensis]MBE9660653.1 ABC transporter permease [Mucilaginibacter myungsuensis]MDN3600698.1 ABC transporter permease [Mucilaginibacter myungsuensis]
MLKNYFKTAWRSLWKHPKTTIINLLGLTIGIAASVLIAMWVQNEYSFDRYHKDADRIHRITAVLKLSPQETWVWETSPFNLSETAKKQIPEIEQVTRVTTAYDGLLIDMDGKKLKQENCAYVDEQWFKMFSYDVVEGSVASFNKNTYGMILTESTAKKYFGKADALGKTLKVDSNNYKVEAIIKDNPANSSFQFNILVTNAARLADPKQKKNDLSWGNYTYQTYLKLKPGTDLKKLGKQLTGIQKANQESTGTNYSLIGLKDIHFESDQQNSSLQHGNAKMVKVFAILAILLMVTACINYVNLTTARASIRSKEVSVRKIVGAGKGHLFGQFMAESFIVTALALVAAVAVIELSMPAFNSITDKHFTQPLAGAIAWIILASALFLCTALNGLYPAFMLSSFKPMNVFRGKSLLNIKDAGIRKTLVVIQFSISVVLIISTLVIYMQMRFLSNTDLGYTKSHIFVFTLPWKVMGFDRAKTATMLSAMRNELNQQSSIANVTQASQNIVEMRGGNSGGFDWDGRDPKFEPPMVVLSADENFSAMMKLKMKEGRWFNKSDQHNVILNETAAQVFGLRKPYIGQRFVNRDDTGTVVGVVKDFHYLSLHDKIGPVMIDSHKGNQGSFYIQTRAGNTPQALEAAKLVWEKYVRDEPFVFSFTDDKYNALYRDDQRISTLITLFAGIAILVSSLGLLGLAAFAAQQRIKEIGIRKVLGASVSNIVTLLSTDFVKMVVIASVLAFPVAWWAMDKWLQDFAYRIDITWWVFAVGASAALIIALITVGIEAVRSAVVNPVKSLRSE